MNYKNWIGYWLVCVSLVHTAFAAIVFNRVFFEIAARGFYNTVGDDPLTGAVVWFALFGVVLFVCGISVASLERVTAGVVPKSIGVGLLVLSVLGVVLMPASGFWLVIPPALAILFRRHSMRASDAIA